jgi:hypothetical protein
LASFGKVYKIEERTKHMYAVEFLANVKNGTIKIPEQYHRRLRNQVRVILLSEEADEANTGQLSIVDVLAKAPGQRLFKTAAEVDEYLQSERQTWDR